MCRRQLLTIFSAIGAICALAQAICVYADSTAAATARACIETVGPTWDVSKYSKYCDPEVFAAAQKSSAIDRLFLWVRSNFGALTAVKKVVPGKTAAPYETYDVFADCQKGPAKISMQMRHIGKNWKVRSLAVDFAPDLPPLSKEALAKLQTYADCLMPLIGTEWDYKKFLAEADPNVFKSEVDIRRYMEKSASTFGSVVKSKCDLTQSACMPNGDSFAKYRCFFTGKKAPGMALITVCCKKGGHPKIFAWENDTSIGHVKPDHPSK